MRTILSTFACLLALAAPAFADEAAASTMSCSYTDTNGDVYEATFSYSNTEASSLLKFNGVEMPALHGCMTWAHGNPRMGGKWRCPHGMAEIRFEVYPVLPGNFAKKPQGMRIIRWNGEQLFSTIETTNCQ